MQLRSSSWRFEPSYHCFAILELPLGIKEAYDEKIDLRYHEVTPTLNCSDGIFYWQGRIKIKPKVGFKLKYYFFMEQCYKSWFSWTLSPIDGIDDWMLEMIPFYLPTSQPISADDRVIWLECTRVYIIISLPASVAMNCRSVELYKLN